MATIRRAKQEPSEAFVDPETTVTLESREDDIEGFANLQLEEDELRGDEDEDDTQEDSEDVEEDDEDAEGAQ